MKNKMTTDMMRVPVFQGEGQLRVQDRPIPAPQRPDDVLVRIEACGICCTDLNILATPPAHKATRGIVIGHEGVGIVEHTGPAVGNVQWATRVVIANRLTCGECAYCRRWLDNQCLNYQTIGTTVDGAFAPYLLALSRDRRSDRACRVMTPPSLSRWLAWGWCGRACTIQPGDNVAIIGAGLMGLLFCFLYRSLGAGRVMGCFDMAPYRLDFAREAVHGCHRRHPR